MFFEMCTAMWAMIWTKFLKKQNPQMRLTVRENGTILACCTMNNKKFAYR